MSLLERQAAARELAQAHPACHSDAQVAMALQRELLAHKRAGPSVAGARQLLELAKRRFRLPRSEAPRT